MLLGNFRTYSEFAFDPIGKFRFEQYEGFVADSWKVNKRLSLELGVRYQYGTPFYTRGNNITNFDPALYDPSRAVTVTTGGVVTVPAGANRFNGLIRAGDGVPAADQSYIPTWNSADVNAVPTGAPRGFYDAAHEFMPRVGFAYSPFNNNRTAIRGGFGMYVDRVEGNIIFPLISNPPFVNSASFENGNLADIRSGAPSALAVFGTISAINPNLKSSRTMNFSLGLQHEFIGGIFVEANAIGNLGRNLIRNPDINTIPFGLANNPTQRPYLGYAAINQRNSDSNSSYYAGQFYAAKRKGDFLATASYTWSKVLTDASGFNDNLEDPFNRKFNYGPASFDRRHVFIATYTYAPRWFRNSNGFVKAVLDGFEVSGITRFQNEIFLRLSAGRDDLKPLTVELARELNRIAKEEDPTRPSTIAFHGNEVYNTTGLGEVADVIGWNLYQGWYSATLADFGKFIDDQHKRFPKRPLIISEYGANADRRLHSTEPRRFDSTIEYQRMFHESYLKQIDERPFISGATIWNQFDFGAEQRGETIPHLNQKGMYYFDRKPKDIHFFYKANLSPEGVLHIATRDWAVRSGTSPKTYSIDIYTNVSEVELTANGRSLGTKTVGASRKASFEVTLQAGVNNLTARGTRNGKRVTDTTEIEYRIITTASPEIAVNVGSNADFTDKTGSIWLADQPYIKGGWGFVGDAAKRGYGLTPDPNILGTDMDPVYQTAVENLTAYRFDLPDGDYEVGMLFTEKLVTSAGKRVFSISANGTPLVTDLDIFAIGGDRRALTRTFKVTAKNGLNFEFAARTGVPILNGIRIKRLK
jgi:hypothetical protein